MSSSILTDTGLLRKPCERVKTIKEGLAIARKLWAELDRNNAKAKNQYGIGLSANQIGILKRVCVIGIKHTKLAFVNPEIIETSDDKIQWNEGCLSLPGQQVDTFRYLWVKIKCLNMPDPVVLGAVDTERWTTANLFECVAAQHEIAHLSGLLMTDFTNENYPVPGREWEEWASRMRSCGESSSV